MSKSKNRKIGGHVSTAGAYYKAAKRAHDIGANAAQIFSSSPRVWKSGWQAKLDPEKYFGEMEKYGINPVYTHALYLVNLASDKDSSVEKSIDSLIDEMKFDSAIRGGGIVVHLGSHQGRGWEASRDRVAKAVSTIIENSPKDANFLIENSAGQNGKVCSNLAEIKWLIDTVGSEQLGWCFDTCHSHAAGYSLASSAEAGEGGAEHSKFSGQPKYALEAIEQNGLWETLKCIHVNDSKGDFDTGKDRHENLLDGTIGESSLKFFLNDERMQNIPLILEVPGIKKEGPDAENIRRLEKLVGEG